ncbi:MAG: ABC transporter ATP-binding protein [Lachnospiraceae bacterium]|jgi:ABC-2 type transport system ATP-binding protein|nr:ABC transporter ATP-binding protein [Lachnospiraceae bacterium]MCH4071107.1 ABC transporter ATP-binding protein [Lachnospiraceae bacterium]MCH4108178.1 ABC transporter ATP-binding protein [Lachnospiraceae bacterium]MCI1302880.1 ABC transporter ATP-binding protein [Lachnospiraceae bacterium]MCI1332129.1 ABC transporter ATP-binding protein [Lachnospiraceae bacterium]
MEKPVLEVRNLKKQYKTKNGTVDAVKGISFQVKKGEIFGFLGANGAGKSTTINMVTTQLLPSGGQILVDGEDLTGNVAAIRRKIGVVAQHNNLERSLTAEENLYFHGLYFGMDERVIRERSEELLKKFGLWDRRKDYVKSYSGGMAQRLKIARAMLHDPEILFLDEPTTGLDPNYRKILWDQMLKMNKEGTTIFLTTHYMEEVENFCQHVAIMKKGEMLACGTVQELEKKTGTHSLNDVFLVLTNRDGVDDRQSANVEE